MRGRFFLIIWPSVGGAKRSRCRSFQKGTSSRAVDADVLDIDSLWIQKIDFYTVREKRWGYPGALVLDAVPCNIDVKLFETRHWQCSGKDLTDIRVLQGLPERTKWYVTQASTGKNMYTAHIISLHSLQSVHIDWNSGVERQVRHDLSQRGPVSFSLIGSHAGVLAKFGTKQLFLSISRCNVFCWHSMHFFPTSLCGVLVFGCALPPPSARRPPSPHNLLTHTQLVTTHLSSHNLLSHNLLTHTTHTQLVHTVTTCPHTTCHHTTCTHTQLCVAGVALMAVGWLWWRAWFPVGAVDAVDTVDAVALCVAGVALGDIDRHFAWQAWHLWHWAWWRAWFPVDSVDAAALCVAGVALGDMALGWLWSRAWFPVDAVVAAPLCMAGVALGDIGLHFAWQAWHLATSTCILRGRRGTHGTGLALARLVPSWRRGRRGSLGGMRGTWRHRPSLCVASVALGDIDLHFAWQAWHLWHWAWWRAWFPVDSVDAAALCVAGVALGDMALGWLLWRAWFPVDAVDAVALWVACVALGDIDRHFAWQAWHLATSTFTLRGRRGTYGTGLAQLFAWQAWHLATSTCILRGRRGTYGAGLALVARLVPSYRPPLCVAGVALGDMYVHFAWQAWHLWHWTGSCGALGSQLTPLSPRLFAWQAWHSATSTTLRGRRGTWWHGRAPCMAGVAFMALDWLWWRAWFPVGRCSRAARLLFSASAVHTHTHAHIHMHT